MTTLQVAEAFATDKKHTFTHGITFGTHPVSCAVALANVEILEREGLVENSARSGDYLLSQLRAMQERHRIVGDVRGIGLMTQVELVRNRETKEPFTDADGLADRVGGRLMERGVLCRAAATINLAPPLVTNREDIDEIVDVVEAVIGEVERELGL